MESITKESGTKNWGHEIENFEVDLVMAISECERFTKQAENLLLQDIITERERAIVMRFALDAQRAIRRLRWNGPYAVKKDPPKVVELTTDQPADQVLGPTLHQPEEEPA